MTCSEVPGTENMAFIQRILPASLAVETASLLASIGSVIIQNRQVSKVQCR